MLVAGIVLVRPADAEEEPVVAEAMVVVSVISAVGCVEDCVVGLGWAVVAAVVDGVENLEVLSRIATLLR